MKLQVVSDLHLEFGDIDLPKTDANVIVLAGDIDVGWSREREYCIMLAEKHEKPVVFVLGNHSFYRSGNVDTIRSQWNEGWDDLASRNVYYLDEGNSVEINDTTFVGGILWTDFNHYDQSSMDAAWSMMNDYNGCRMSLKDSGGKNISTYRHDEEVPDEYAFTPRRSVDEHYKIKDWINYVLQQSETKYNVVVSHHLPSKKSVDMRRYGLSAINEAYYSNLDDFIEVHNIDLWIHGHTHSSNDYMVEDTRVLSNPRGYHNYEENPDFQDDLVIEITGNNLEDAG